jgi:hypothetical protein
MAAVTPRLPNKPETFCGNHSSGDVTSGGKLLQLKEEGDGTTNGK